MKTFDIPFIANFTNWNEASKLTDFSSPWIKVRNPKTEFLAYYDNQAIHFKFIAYGPKPLIFVENNNKLEVIHSERVEIFFREDERMTPYYCLEMDPNKRVLDYKANHYRKFQREWTWPSPLSLKSEIKENYYSLEGEIKLETLKELNLIKENQIQIGLYRGHCEKLEKNIGTINWICWVDSGSETPDFHIPSSFGILNLK